ncbi:MAG: glycosyltransferase [Rivularia sp. (in: Bacteria)]|nr:glycosyltransferase [Rivularia sp. MS3]
MNIYIYLKNFPPKGLKKDEGMRKSIHGLASGLTACGENVTVLCENATDSSFKTKSGYTIKAFANHNYLRPSFNISKSLQNYIREHLANTDSIVVINGIFHPSVYSLSRLLRKYSVPYIMAPHDPYHPSIFSKNAHLKWPYWYLFEKQLLNKANAVQILDIRHDEYLKNLGIKTPAIEVSNGFSPVDIKPESSLNWHQEEKVKLFFLGRLDSFNKGLDLLLDTFAEFIKTIPAELTIQGPDKGDRKALEEQAAKLNLNGKVFFLDPDYNQTPTSLIQNYDIFCLPSRFEGFSLAALEAMMAGRVILISEVAGIAPHIKESGSGVVIKPEVSAIKAGLMELLNRRSEWKEMGLRGRRYVLENLSWEKIASDALKNYKHLYTESLKCKV